MATSDRTLTYMYATVKLQITLVKQYNVSKRDGAAWNLLKVLQSKDKKIILNEIDAQ